MHLINKTAFDEIVEFMQYTCESSEESESEIVPLVTNKEALAAISCLERYYFNAENAPDNLLKMIAAERQMIMVRIEGNKKQRSIESYFKLASKDERSTATT